MYIPKIRVFKKGYKPVCPSHRSLYVLLAKTRGYSLLILNKICPDRETFSFLSVDITFRSWFNIGKSQGNKPCVVFFYPKEP